MRGLDNQNPAINGGSIKNEDRWSKWMTFSVTAAGLVLAGLCICGVLTGCKPKLDIPSIQSK